ncbi:MAG: RNA polymerase sigma factor [Patescibacteria group bacterium]
MPNNSSSNNKDSWLGKSKRKGRELNVDRKVIKKKDKEAFMQAYDMYLNDIYRFVFFKVKRAEDAQDITAGVFLKAWNKVRENKLEDKKTLKALLYTIARNAVIDHYRNAVNASTVNMGDQDNKFDIPDIGRNMAEQAEINSDMEIVLEKMKELKDEYREILILRYINELSFKEISAITGKSKNNVRVISHRALKALRELMEG